MGVFIRGWSRLWGLLLRLVVGGRKSNFFLSRFVKVEDSQSVPMSVRLANYRSNGFIEWVRWKDTSWNKEFSHVTGRCLVAGDLLDFFF
jgi:hypothetical protein